MVDPIMSVKFTLVPLRLENLRGATEPGHWIATSRLTSVKEVNGFTLNQEDHVERAVKAESVGAGDAGDCGELDGGVTDGMLTPRSGSRPKSPITGGRRSQSGVQTTSAARSRLPARSRGINRSRPARSGSAGGSWNDTTNGTPRRRASVTAARAFSRVPLHTAQISLGSCGRARRGPLPSHSERSAIQRERSLGCPH